MTKQFFLSRIKRLVLPVSLALIAGAGVSSAAHAVTYADLASYSAAAGTASTPITFSDVSVPNDAANTFNNLTPIASNSYAGWNLPNASVVGTGYAFGVASQALTEDPNATLALYVTDPSAVSVGFNVAVFGGGQGIISVFDGGTLLAQRTVSTVDETQFTSFFGYVGTAPVTEVTITPVDKSTVALATNLQYSVAAVPEPTSIALMLGGLLLFMAVVRRPRS